MPSAVSAASPPAASACLAHCSKASRACSQAVWPALLGGGALDRVDARVVDVVGADARRCRCWSTCPRRSRSCRRRRRSSSVGVLDRHLGAARIVVRRIRRRADRGRARPRSAESTLASAFFPSIDVGLSRPETPDRAAAAYPQARPQAIRCREPMSPNERDPRIVVLAGRRHRPRDRRRRPRASSTPSAASTTTSS